MIASVLKFSAHTVLMTGFIAGTLYVLPAQAFSNKNLSIQNKSSSYMQVADAANSVKAKQMISSMGDKAIGFLADTSLSQSQKEAKFRTLLEDHFDMTTIGRFALGKNWKSANPAQQKEYSKLFEDLIVRVYSARFRDYKGQAFDVASAQEAGKNDVLVTSFIVPDAGSKVQVDWRIRNRGGNYQVIDVIIEGVSMTMTQRSDFSSVIQRGGGNFEVLLDHLRK